MVVTWSIDTKFISPVKRFCTYNSSARKNVGKGRPSGGLTLIVDKSCYPNLRSVSDCAIIIECFLGGNSATVVALIYLPPNDQFDFNLKEVFDKIKETTRENKSLLSLRE